MKRKTNTKLQLKTKSSPQVLNTQAKTLKNSLRKILRLDTEKELLARELSLQKATSAALEKLCDVKDANYKEIKATNDSMYEEIAWYRSLIKDAILGTYTKKEDNGKLNN